ncbi:MAG: phosphatase PAP2 family protein [Gemmatimonadaceae bacterium]|nr:phosphatase PAP2 family protein [Gemmatimonadaceae bacterium]
MQRRALILVVGVVFALSACDNTVQPTEVLPPLQAANLDASAGSWQMFVLSGPDQIAVAPPAAVASDAYRAELEVVKTAQGKMTAAQRRNVDYWSGGSVLRWNQITRAFVARFNLPPVPRDDGSYPIPDANNPFADSQFPFANPPYAARAYSYVAVAQYEALKAAWHWKFRYNRPSPSRVDKAVKRLVPDSDLPAYPSEEAVLSGVSAEMLKLLFPAAVEDITLLAAEERESALLSGKATASDIAAGLALGQAVANAVIARARTDGMGNAVGNAALWKALVDSTVVRGETPWISLDVPPRPPMLPNFGKVLAWTMTRTQLTATAPPAPPSTSSSQMKSELDEVRRTMDGLTRGQLAIAQRWNDGAGTYTPPGHWNDIAAEYVRDARMSEVRAARAFALLNVAMHDAAVACWGEKYRFYNPRPGQLDPRIKTSIGLPNFPAYPSGHSTFSAAAASVLSYLFPAAAPTFEAQADEAGISRLYGGIHYRSDIDQGKAHGQRVGAYAVRFGQLDRSQ